MKQIPDTEKHEVATLNINHFKIGVFENIYWIEQTNFFNDSPINTKHSFVYVTLFTAQCSGTGTVAYTIGVLQLNAALVNKGSVR